MEEHRKQSGVIWLTILEGIPLELTVYERNREHLIRIEDRSLRRELQNFLTNAGIAANGARNHLIRQIELENQISRKSVINEDTRGQLIGDAEIQKKLCNERYLELKELVIKANPLREKLSKL
jgi:hypothetical protein